MTGDAVKVFLTTENAVNTGVPLAEWLRIDPDYRTIFTPVPVAAPPGRPEMADTVLTGVLTPIALLGLFRLLSTWIDMRRFTDTKVRIRIKETEFELAADGRANADQLAADAMRVAGFLTGSAPDRPE